MDFFNSAVGVLQTLVVALGAGLGNRSKITGRTRNKKTLQTPKKGLQRCFLASQRGFEPPTPRLGGVCSIQLSY